MRSLRSFLSSSVEFCPAPRDLPAATGQPGLRPRLHASRTLCTAKINNSGQSSTLPILHHRIPERIHGAPPSPTDLRWSPRAQPRTCFSPSPLRSGGLQPGERAAGERSSFFSLGGRTFRSDIKPPNTPCHSERSGPAFSSARFLCAGPRSEDSLFGRSALQVPSHPRRYGSQCGFCVTLRPKICRSSKIEMSGFSGS